MHASRALALAALIIIGIAHGDRCARSEQVSIVAHRGGTPLHRQSSFEAYKAIAESNLADFLECDLTITKDNVLVCSHGPDLSSSTTIGDDEATKLGTKRVEILNPVRGEAEELQDWFIPDYAWEPTIVQFSAACVAWKEACSEIEPERLATLDDIWELARLRSLNTSRPVGLYLEIKHSLWHQTRRNRDILGLLLEFIGDKEGGLDVDFEFPIYLQSFEYVDLLRAKKVFGSGRKNFKTVGLIEDKYGRKNSKAKSSTASELPQAKMLVSRANGNSADLEVVAIGSRNNERRQRDYCDERIKLASSQVRQRAFAWVLLGYEGSEVLDIECIVDVLGIDLRILREHPELGEIVKSKGIDLHSWTIATKEDTELAVRLGVSGLITDVVETTERALRRGGKFLSQI